MANYLQIKSVAKSVFDIKTADLSKYIPPFTPDLKQVEVDISRMSLKYGKATTPEKIEKGDMAVISCESEIDRFNKPAVTVNIGKNLYSAELEKAIIGMSTGETKVISVNDTEVTVSVKNISRRIPSELTDKAISEWGLDGVASLEDLRRYCIGKQVESFLDEDETADEAAAYLTTLAVNNSEFIMDDNEVALADNEAEKKFADILSDSEMSAEEETFMRKLTFDMQQASLKLAVIGYQMCIKDNTLTGEERYLEYLKGYGYSDIEKAKEKCSVFRYMVDYYADYFCKYLDEYLLDYYKKLFSDNR